MNPKKVEKVDTPSGYDPEVEDVDGNNTLDNGDDLSDNISENLRCK